eukprot:2867034-Pyramimonas_sp.AAC.1
MGMCRRRHFPVPYGGSKRWKEGGRGKVDLEPKWPWPHPSPHATKTEDLLFVSGAQASPACLGSIPSANLPKHRRNTTERSH